MKRVTMLAITVSLLVTLFLVTPRAENKSNQASCLLVERALRDYQQVKSARTRREVEKYFIPDGGLQFPAATRYVYPECEYLHVDVGFELVKPAEIASLPDDKVIRVSKVYLEYPAKD